MSNGISSALVINNLLLLIMKGMWIIESGSICRSFFDCDLVAINLCVEIV